MKSTNPMIDGKPMSFVRLRSRVAGFYYPGEQKGRVKDRRGIIYEFLPDGMRAVNKPRSRVKRLREERMSISKPIRVGA